MNLPVPVIRRAAALPAVVTAAGERARIRFLEFFVADIRNAHARRAYGRAIGHSGPSGPSLATSSSMTSFIRFISNRPARDSRASFFSGPSPHAHVHLVRQSVDLTLDERHAERRPSVPIGEHPPLAPFFENSV